MTRIKKERLRHKLTVFKNILSEISSISTSSRLKVACSIVKKDFSKIASFGYNGNYSNAPINSETGTEEESLEPGKDGYIHAEVNSIAKFREYMPTDYIVLITHSPCVNCSKILVNSGFKDVYWIESYRETSHISAILEANKIQHGNWDQLFTDLSSKI